MRINSLFATIVCVGLCSAPAWAETVDCAKAETTVDLTMCAEQDYRKSDDELNRIYDQALASIDKRSGDGVMTAAQLKDWKEDLRTSQRAWISFRDADCNRLTGWEWFGGSIAPAAAWNCLSAKTQARSEELKDRYVAQQSN
jgi:uncharacterized protein YecT (DUF1311 family)